MFQVEKRAAPVLTTILAALVVGCGGGGGGPQGASLPAGGAGTLTGGTLTGGASTAGAPNVGTSDGGAGSASGTATSGGTTGGSTAGAGGSSAGAPTTGGSASGGSTAGSTSDGGSTTGGATTGSSATGGASTGGTPPTGMLRPDAIYFGLWGDAGVVSSVLPDGTGRLDEAGGGSSVAAVVPDADHAGKFVYAALSGGSYGIYRGSTLVVANSETLVAPVYDGVSSLQAVAGGRVAMIATKSGATRLFLIDGGAVRDVDEADSAAISLDGAHVAYTNSDGLHVWSPDTSASRLLMGGGDALFPSFSKDGAWILFSSNRDGTTFTPWDLYQIPTGGGAVERITNTPNVSELGGCYNADRTRISYVGLSEDVDLSGIYVASNAGAVRIVSGSDLNLGTYWTDAQGRALGARGGRFQRLDVRKR